MKSIEKRRSRSVWKKKERERKDRRIEGREIASYDNFFLKVSSINHQDQKNNNNTKF